MNDNYIAIWNMYGRVLVSNPTSEMLVEIDKARTLLERTFTVKGYNPNEKCRIISSYTYPTDKFELKSVCEQYGVGDATLYMRKED